MLFGYDFNQLIQYTAFFENIFMIFCLKRMGIAVLTLLLCLIVLVCSQGWQYIAAYSGAGFARPLPNPTNYGKGLTCTSQPIQIMSFNVMYGSATIESLAARFRGGDTGDNTLPWSGRIPEIRERIASYSPDLLGLQEMEADSDINAIVPLDQYSLVTYHLGSFQYGDAALLFKTARFEPLDSGQLWLGPKPDLPMSYGFRPLAMIRYVNWVLLREKATGFRFMYVNTHFDNASKNKEPSATLFRERITELAKGLPIVVTGDFNTTANTDRYLRFSGAKENPPLLTNVYDLVAQPTNDKLLHPDKLIDHILVGGPCKVVAEQWLVDTRPLKNGKAMSDHNLIDAKLRFTP